jgi:hypothetical protein
MLLDGLDKLVLNRDVIGHDLRRQVISNGLRRLGFALDFLVYPF